MYTRVSSGQDEAEEMRPREEQVEQVVLRGESVMQLALRELRQSYCASREFLLALVPDAPATATAVPAVD